MNELESFGAGLEQKPMMVVAAKVDVANPEKLAKLRKYCEKRRYPFSAISAVTGEGINKLKWEIGAIVRQMRSGNYEGPRPRVLKIAPAKKSSAGKVSAAVKSRKLTASKPRIVAEKETRYGRARNQSPGGGEQSAPYTRDSGQAEEEVVVKAKGKSEALGLTGRSKRQSV